MKITSFLFLAVIALTSCVSSKKYDMLQSSLNDIQGKYFELQKANEKNLELIDALRAKEEALDSLNEEYKKSREELQSFQMANEHLKKQYDDLLSSKEQVVQSASESRTMLDQKERELAEQRAELEALQNKLNGQAQYLEEIKNSIRNAILGYDDEDLSLYEKQGKLYVSLSENLLFAKGSATLDSEGKNAIQKIASTLSGNKDLNLEVLGHTDSDGTEKLNWKLSTDRALSVLHELTAGGVDANNVTASGRAFYDPIAPNDTEVNKSKNRRTEIILAPKLDEIFNYLEGR